MSRRARIALALAGITLMVVSLIALAYVAWPADSAREQFRVAPTAFVAPAE